MIGTSIGTYRITAKLGAGGMGEVYRARDTKLDRDVAIKILPDSFAHDAERVARFEREAKVLAALNHPNIAQIYGLEERALVMELVEGPTLAERIAQGPVPLDEALNIAKQIAEALEAAHEKGITHRDLKPANVKLRPDGTVKVLDFGLATVAQLATGDGASATISPTLTMEHAATHAGMIMGTAAYMSPEQARGQQVDKRADIWAFGVVLYEMLMGQRLFEGKTVSDTLAAVLIKEPNLSTLSPRVRHLLESCLDKDPKQRLQAIGDWRLLIAREMNETARPEPTHRPITSIIRAGVLVLGLGVTGAVWYRATRPSELKPLVRLDVDLGRDVSLVSAAGANAILSPDGMRLVYVSQNRLFTRRLDQPKGSELPGTDGALEPFFSPDGQWVAFFTRGKLKKISVDGGAAVTLCDTGNARGGSWGDDGTIVAALNANNALSRISSAGGTPSPLIELAQGEYSQRWPQILPGHKAVLFSSSTGGFGAGSTGNVDVITLPDHRRKTLVRGGIFGRYLPVSNGTGYLVYMNSGTLFATRFDPNKLDVLGAPAPVLEQIAYNSVTGSAEFDFARNGTLIYQTGSASGGLPVTVQWLDAAGKMQPLLAKPGTYGRPSLSPDGQRLALEITDSSDTDVWIYEWRRDTLTRLTFGGSADGGAWSPDSRYIALRTTKGISWTRADGSGQLEPLTLGPNRASPWSFTPDGKRLAFFGTTRGGNDLWTVPIEIGDAGLRAGKPEVFLATPSDERYPSFSPDGKWLAYVSDESGTQQVYVRAFPNKGGKWQISNEGGLYPIWSRNGHELFFEGLDSRIMTATYIVKGDSFVADKPRLWSDKKLAGVLNTNRSFDVAPDGKRVAALFAAENAEGSQQARNNVIFLENFFDELRRRVPLSK